MDNPGTLSLSDLTSSVQPGLAIELDVWKGDWGVLGSVFAVDYEGKAATSQNAIFTTQAEESVGRLVVGRRVVHGSFGGRALLPARARGDARRSRRP